MTFAHAANLHIPDTNVFSDYQYLHRLPLYIPNRGESQCKNMAISNTELKVSSKETCGDRLHTLFEEARAANKIGQDRKPLSEFLQEFEGKQKAFEDAQRKKFQVSGASSNSSTVTLIQHPIDQAESSTSKSPIKSCGPNIIDSPPTLRERSAHQANSKLPSMSTSSSSSPLPPVVSAHQAQ